ncbi:hypothetical protein J6590_021702 [Homalodisca vitripennis]|nr:hypothetical protein J6590_021702 [Homalodisca vitripennis]
MSLLLNQGSILGPVLFLVYISRRNSSLLRGKMVQYVDDTTLCIKAPTKHELEIISFLVLNSCIQFFSKLNLRTNNSKSNALNFCLRQREIEDRAAVMADDVLIEETDSTKFLGMYLEKSDLRQSH